MADQELETGNGHSPDAAGGNEHSPDVTGDKDSSTYEDLQSQLQEMEQQEQVLAAELEQVTEPQLDSHLAVIEEQFRKSFDERFASSSAANKTRGMPQIWEDQEEVLRTNKIFREVSRCLGDEWRPVFNELMSGFPTDVIESERAMVESQQPLIQGYKALMAWKEVAGPNFTIIKLVDALRNNNMDDIADETLTILDNQDNPKSKDKTSKPVQRRKSDVTARSKQNPLDNRRMLLIAKKIGGDWESLGKELGISEEEMAEIKETEGSTYQGTFKVLWAWRQTDQPNGTTVSIETLKAVLEKIGKKDVAEQLDAN